ncbi:MAG: tetratricopeptide repeat protein [Bacteroidota bacterium]|nr:tetratricopeptide repeat protein [Bacteroidota bacterium]
MKNVLLILISIFAPAWILAQPAYIYHEKGKKLFDQGKYLESIVQFDLAIKADATYFEGYLDRGRANQALGKNELAMVDYIKTTQLNAKYAPGFFYKAKLNAQLGNDQLAITDYTTAIKLNPDYLDSYVNRGMLYVKTKQTENALTDFNKAISLDAKNAEVVYQRGILYRDMKKQTEALADFTKAVTLNPNMGKAWFEQGKIHASQNKNDAAVAEYSKAVTFGFATEELYRAKGAANTALGKNDDAIKDYSMVIEQFHSKDADMYRVRGELYAKQKNYPFAVRDFNKALALKKDDIPTLLARADATIAQGKTKYIQAETDYKKVLTLEANNVRAARGLGKMYFEQEKWQLAADHLSIAIKAGGTAEDYDLRGKANFKLNNKKGACEDFSKAEQMGFPDAGKDKLSAGCK